MFRQDLLLNTPWINAAGTLGFTPPPVSRQQDRARSRLLIEEPLGAFITNPISLGPRTPAAERALLRYSGGVLMHTGLPNPGISRVLKRYADRWAQSNLPVWAHLIGSNPDEIHQMVQRLEGVEGLMAIEIGLPPDAHDDNALAFVNAAFSELPIIIHVAVTCVGEAWLKQLPDLGVSAISLGAPRGTLTTDTNRPISGRLYGPALFPLMLSGVQSLRRLGIPIIAGGGIYRRQDAQALHDTGALAVQLDTVLWRGWVD